MRFVLSPERNETFIDTVEVDTAKFRNSLMALAHAPEVGLFAYECPKQVQTGISDVNILQIGQADRRDARDEVNLKITTTGTVIIDANVTGRTGHSPTDRDIFGQLFYVLESDLGARLVSFFAFTDALFDQRDAFKRYDRFLYNVALHNVGQRILGTQIPNASSITVPDSITAPVAAFDAPQLLSRDELAHPTAQIEAILSLLRRRIKPRNMFGQSL